MKRWQVVALIVGLVVIGAVLLIKKPAPKPANPVAKKETLTDKSVARLFQEAKQKLKQNKPKEAIPLLKQILSIKPNDEKAKQLLAKTETEIAKEEKNSMVKDSSGNQETSSRGSKKKNNGSNETNKDNQNDGQNDGNQNQEENPSAPGGDQIPIPKPLSSNLTPLDILPTAIDGYQVIDRRWDKEPVAAVAVFTPNDKSTANEVERVILTAAKFNSKGEAETKLHVEKEIFPQEPQADNVNNHSVYVGLENPSAAPEFWQLRRALTLAWARDNWFFSVQVIARGTPSTDVKKGMAKYIASEFGY